MIEIDSAQIEKVALLYDVGKFILRTQGKIESDFDEVVEITRNFLSKYLIDETGKKILDCLKIKDEQSKDICSLLKEADILASGTNSRKIDRLRSEKLENVFNIFGKEGKITTFDLRVMKHNELVLPEIDDDKENLSEKYAVILNTFEEYLKKISVSKCTPNDIAQILENVWSYVPAGSAENELSDISLYDHAKLMAAYAVCLHKYFQENHFTDFTNAINEKLHDKEIFLLVSGDISGIQQFIYTIPSKGALKSLRGRSFYLEILLEHIADEILTGANVSRNCLLYTGGGHFYLLLPNTSEVDDLLKTFSEKVNSWFLQNFGSRLYLAIAWTPASAREFIGETESGSGAVFQRVSRKLSEEKLCRYSESQLQDMFDPQSSINKTLDESRECGICHTSSKELLYYNDEDDTLACDFCRNLYVLGKKMLDGEGFIVAKKFIDNYDESLPLPSLNNNLVLYPITKGEKLNVPIVRKYLKKRDDSVQIGAIGIWLADYVTCKNDGKDVLAFEELAEISGGTKNAEGIKRLGVMRADVDNLGAAFMAGFPRKFATLTRSATLSRQLAHFFKHIIMFICKGELTAVNETPKNKFSLFGRNKKSCRDIHVVYSGGDDVFLVGAWDDLIELAVDIRRTFEQFTNGKLTFSAGIGFFKPQYPVSGLARKTGFLEDTAKHNPGKDSLSLFGVPTIIKGKDQEPEKAQTYSWKNFAENVCGKKLSFLFDNFNFDVNLKINKKLTLGKSGLYRILNFLADTNSNRKSVNLARFAYLLARLNPGQGDKERFEVYEKIRDQFYFWYKSEQDRQELRTAIELVIYSLR